MAISLFVSSSPDSEVRVSLNNKIFYLTLKFSTREQGWYLGMLDVNRNTILSGVKLQFGSIPTKTISDVIDGNIYVVNNDESMEPLGRNNLGQELKYELVYLTKTEEAEVF